MTDSSIKRLGILGGTFNPIHIGHMSLARGFAQSLSLDRLLLIPVWSPPHKSAKGILPAQMRFEMCRIACQNCPPLKASNIEIERGGISYTVDTLRGLAAEYPAARLYLITGADMFLTLEKWKNFTEISRLADLCACSRRKGEFEALNGYAERLEERYGSRCHVERFPAVEVSSTQVRGLLKNGGDVSGLLPPAVLEYIRSNNLYTD